MRRLWKILDAIGYVAVLIVSRLLNVATLGSGRQDFSYRCYIKASTGDARWLRAMRAVDWLFAYSPRWTGYRTETHCFDVAWKARKEAYEVIDEVSDAIAMHGYLKQQGSRARDSADARARKAGL